MKRMREERTMSYLRILREIKFWWDKFISVPERVTGITFTLQPEASTKQTTYSKQWCIRHWTSKKKAQWSPGKRKQTRWAHDCPSLVTGECTQTTGREGEPSQSLMDSLSRDGAQSPGGWGKLDLKGRNAWEEEAARTWRVIAVPTQVPRRVLLSAHVWGKYFGQGKNHPDKLKNLIIHGLLGGVHRGVFLTSVVEND